LSQSRSPGEHSDHGLATHYIPSARVPLLLESLSALEKPTYAQVNEAIEDLHYDIEPTDPIAPFSGAIREALDSAFSQGTVEGIIAALEHLATNDADADVVKWAKDTLAMLEERSPTSLKIALMAVRKGKLLDLLESFNMELGIATAFCVSTSDDSFLYSHLITFQRGASPDLHTGVISVLLKKVASRPAWSPASLDKVDVASLEASFFQPHADLPQLVLPEALRKSQPSPPSFLRYGLPSEDELQALVEGRHASSGSGALTLQELTARAEGLRVRKHGVARKVQEVVTRRCHTDKDGYLQWRH
jgi:3-hydroxyisobutyryl-CoA hydrolase